jgi:hypothetical protein
MKDEYQHKVHWGHKDTDMGRSRCGNRHLYPQYLVDHSELNKVTCLRCRAFAQVDRNIIEKFRPYRIYRDENNLHHQGPTYFYLHSIKRCKGEFMVYDLTLVQVLNSGFIKNEIHHNRYHVDELRYCKEWKYLLTNSELESVKKYCKFMEL